eukprot:g5515.t1
MNQSPSARWGAVLLTLTCACWFGTAAGAKNPRLEDKGPPPPTLPFEPLTPPVECLPCEDLFSQLEEVDGGLVQRVEMTERGAPKSGTGGMFEWAMGALYHTCQYLNQHYGRDTCHVEWGRWGPGDYYGNHTLIFEPPQEQPADAPCPCSRVRRVTITLSKIDKHTLPVEETCPYSHGVGYHLYLDFCREADEISEGREATNGTRPAIFERVWRCMQDAQCPVVDDRKQMVIFRDPRAASVSSFFFLKAGGYIPEGQSIDEFVIQNFPVFCKWLVIRLALFSKMFPKDNVAVFWYDRWQSTPLKWHRHLFQAVGLRVPETVAAASSQAALADDFPFFSKGRDAHLGTVPPVEIHTYRDDISVETARSIDETMKQWLPPKFISQLQPVASRDDFADSGP